MHWRTQHALTHHGPRVLALLSLGIVAVLFSLGPSKTVPGYAEVAPVRVASLEPGRLTRVTVNPGDIVAGGDVIGLLDDSPIQGRIRVLQAELNRHGAMIEGGERTARATLRDAEAARKDTASRIRATRSSLAIASAQAAELEAQVARGLATRVELAEPQARVANLKGELERLTTRLEYEGGSLADAQAGVSREGDEPAPAVLEQARALGVAEEELALLEQRLADLTLRAPLAARVGAVNYRPGEVLPAQSVLAELFPLVTTTVVACLPEHIGIATQVGDGVALFPADGGERRSGIIVDVVGLVSEAPERCKQRPNETGWVRPVRIEVDDGNLVPGQRFDVTFLGTSPAADQSQVAHEGAP
ncbi:MAG: hypothetical protein CL928_01905 [Deltaproteobacteria bacterium]|nr:hypothetical protein [Deltaproteobacteria bacterium]